MENSSPLNISIKWKLLGALALAFAAPILLEQFEATLPVYIFSAVLLGVIAYWYIDRRVLGIVNRLLRIARKMNSSRHRREEPFSRDELSNLVHTFDNFYSELEHSYTATRPTIETVPDTDSPGDTVLLKAVRGHAVFKAALATGDTIVGESAVLPRRVDEDLIISSRLAGTYAQKLFVEAVSSVHDQLDQLSQVPELSEEDRGIIGFQSMLLEDEALLKGIETCLADGLSLPESLNTTFAVITSKLEASKNTYIAARATDCQDLRQRLMDTIIRQVNPGVDDFYSKVKDKIVLCQQIYPSEVIMLHRAGAIGIVSAQGTASSHAEILMQSFNIPSLSNIDALSVHMLKGRKVLLDTNKKRLVIDPSDEEVDEATRRAQYLSQRIIPQAVTLLSGEEVFVHATINNVDIESARAVQMGADGVGLLRTEMSFIGRADMPSEEELYEEYHRLTQAFDGKAVTMRMLDLGSDKASFFQPDEREENPCMGNRSMRLLLKRPGIFRRQLRAMLRAAHGDTCILFPMISGWHELEKIRVAIDRMTDEFLRDGGEIKGKICYGIMVEVPSIVQRFEDYVDEFDVFNIGTNDLTQYALAADRNNESVAEYFKTYHPSILSMIRRVCDLGDAAGKKICVCGEMASDVHLLPLLVGLGVRHLSIPSVLIPKVKQRVRSLDLAVCKEIAEEALECKSTDDVEDILADYKDTVIKVKPNGDTTTTVVFDEKS